jgi:hypothetical protein
MAMDETPFRFGLSRPHARFQRTNDRVSTFALRHRMLLPSMHFTRRHCAVEGVTMVRPVCDPYIAPITTQPSSSIQTDIGSRRIAVQARRDGCSDFKSGHYGRAFQLEAVTSADPQRRGRLQVAALGLSKVGRNDRTRKCCTGQSRGDEIGPHYR